MGVKELWSLVSPTGQLLPLSSLEGQAVAVDLSCWVVDSQALHVGYVTRPHLRNLFFRTSALLNAGVLPVFVLEGDAPSLKWDTISSRNQRNFHPSVASKNVSLKTGKRSRFKSILKECRELLDLLGVPWVQASGEAEATCAALSYHEMVKGVISQDSDVFLYGGQTVFRNFTANQNKATVERFSMEILEDRLQLTREGLIVLGILLGCDYMPGGVQGVGRETAMKLLRAWYEAGEKKPLQRMCSWTAQDSAVSQQQLSHTKWKKGSMEELEGGVRKRVLATDGFPFTEIIQEFQQKLKRPASKIQWSQPCYEELVKWCIHKLEWEPDYAVEKSSPVVTRWIVTHGTMLKCLQPVGIVKQCVRGGVAACKLQWKVATCGLPKDTAGCLTIVEPLYLVEKSLPHLLHEFKEKNIATNKGKNKKKPKDAKMPVKNYDKGLVKDNSNKLTQEDSILLIQDNLKKLSKHGIKHAKNENPKIVNNISSMPYTNSQGNEFTKKSVKNQSSHIKEQTNTSGKLTWSGGHFVEEMLNQTLTDEEENEDLSFIIDKIINIKVNSNPTECRISQQTGIQGESKNQKIGMRNSTQNQGEMQIEEHLKSYNLCKENMYLKDMNNEKLFDSEKKDQLQETSCRGDEYEDKENNPENFFDRIYRKLYKRNKENNLTNPVQNRLSCKLNKALCTNPNDDSLEDKSYICKDEEMGIRNPNIYTKKGDSDELSDARKSHCELKQPSQVLVQKAILHENHTANEFLADLYHDFCSPKSEVNSSFCQVSKDMFDDTDDLGVVASHTSLPNLQSTPYLIGNGASDMPLHLIEQSPNACVIKMDSRLSCLSYTSPLQHNLEDSCKKLLHDKCLLSSTLLSSNISDILNYSDSRLNRQSSANTCSRHIKYKNDAVSSGNCNPPICCNTPRINKRPNMSKLCFQLFDSFSDCEDSISKDSRPAQVNISYEEKLQQLSMIKISHTHEKENNLYSKYSNKESFALHTQSKENEQNCNSNELEINECKSVNLAVGKQDRGGKASICPGTDDETMPCDPFSPFGVNLTLAERLRMKFPYKTFVKLLDDI